MLNLDNKADREKLEEQIEADINSFCESYYEHGHRNHLGASEVGDNCWRKLWYKFRWVKKAPFDGRMLRLFNVGHSAEPRFIAYLRGIGFEVKEFEKDVLHYHPESDSYHYGADFDPGDGLVHDVTGMPNHEDEALKRGIKPVQWRITGADGHYGGSLDGKCKAPARYMLDTALVLLNEFKTNNTGPGYTKVADEDLIKSKPKHFAQMCQYGYKYKLKYGIYLIENKNDSDITIKIVTLDWEYGRSLEDKAEKIIASVEPPSRIAENPSYFDCKYCDFTDICHHGETPEKNCRSCRQASPVADAKWHCSRFNAEIPQDFIKTGCPDWNAI